jgi:hypothetical protein
MYRHTTSRLRGPFSRDRAWWKAARRVHASTATGIRTDLISRVREEIAAGRYDTPEKWDAALDRLLARLDRP